MLHKVHQRLKKEWEEKGQPHLEGRKMLEQSNDFPHCVAPGNEAETCQANEVDLLVLEARLQGQIFEA